MSPVLVVLLVAVGAFVLAALAQAVTGFGSALVSVPLLAFAVGPADAVVGATMVGLVLTAMGWRRERGHVDRARVRTLALTGMVGMPVGFLLLAALRPAQLTMLIAGTVLVLVALLAAGLRLPAGRGVQRTAGLVSGALLTSTGMNGPPLVLANQDLPPRSFRASLQAVFCVQDTVAVLGFVALGHVTRDSVLVLLGGVLALAPGWMLGDLLFRRIPAERFRWLVLCGLTVTAVSGLLSIR